MAKNREEQIEELILKVAKGFQLAEVTEEFVEVDGEMKLMKRKKTRKEVPPDWKALQLLIEGRDEDFGLSTMSDEELERERERLLKQLQEKSGGENAAVTGDLNEDVDCGGEADVARGERKPRAKARKKKPTLLNGGKK